MPSPSFQKFLSLFGIAMVALYLTVGYVLIFRFDMFPEKPHWSAILGGCFLLYAIFRGYRVYVNYKKTDDEE